MPVLKLHTMLKLLRLPVTCDIFEWFTEDLKLES